MKIIIAGSRSIKNYSLVKRVIKESRFQIKGTKSSIKEEIEFNKRAHRSIHCFNLNGHV